MKTNILSNNTNMEKSYIVKCFAKRIVILTVLLIAISAGKIWGADNTVTYTVTGVSAVSTSGTAPTGSSASYTQDYTTAGQMTESKKNSLLTLTGFDGKRIKGISLNMRATNSKKGSITIKVGSTTICTSSGSVPTSTSYADYEMTLTNQQTVGTSESVTIKISANGSSVFIASYTITYDTPPTRTVTWYVNGSEYTTGSPTTSVPEGSRVATLPTAPSIPCGDRIFVGWTETEEYANMSTPPSVLFNDAASSPVILTNKSFYALFAVQEDQGSETSITGGSTVGSLPEDWTGSYDGFYSGNGVKFSAANQYVQSEDISSNNNTSVTVKIKAGYNGSVGSVLTISTLDASGDVISSKDFTPTETYDAQSTTNSFTLVGGDIIKYVRVTMSSKTSNVGMSYCEIYSPRYTYSDYVTSCTTYSEFRFSCAELELDEPNNSATENVVSNVVYMTSTAGQKVRSLAHFHVHGDGLTPSQEVKFTAGSTALDALYTFKKADGTAVMTNASGEVDDDVYVYYQPTETSDGRDNVTSVKAYVERKGDGSGKPKAVINDERPINGRHLPEQFIIAAKAGDYWYALPADMVSSGAHAGYSFTPNSSSAPTQANVAPEAAVYNFYGYATSSPYDSSFIRLASDKTSKALWSNKSNSSIGITNKAAIDGGSAKGEQYEWRLTNTGADTYNLWNHAANLTGRNLGLQKSDKKWNMYADGSTVVKELRILPVVSISAYIELLGEDWQESAFTYTKVSGTIPEHHHIQVTYNGDTYTATESGTTVTITDADFAAAGGFAAAPGTQLTLEWCNEDGAVLAQGSLFTPIFITSNTVNLSDYEADVLRTTDVFITNGAKLTVNENTTVHDVTVNAGSTLLVDKAGESTGATLTMSSGKLTLRGGWTTIGGDSKYDMPRVYINPLSSLAKTNTTINLYMDIFKSEDGKHYYPFAVPFAVAVNDVKYVDPTLAAAAVYNKHYVIKRYNGANRAENGTGDGNWEVVPAGSILKPGEGYIITAVAVGGKAQLVVPMKNVTNSWLALGEQATVSDSTKNVIKVTAHTGTATAGGGANNRHKGWNMVGVPFMSCYTSGTDMYSGEGSADLMSGRMELSGDVSDPYAWETSEVVYVSVPTHDFSEYIQTDITTAQLVPGWSFFIQVGKTGNLTFLTTKQAESSSTPLYAPQREISPIVKTGIVLTGGEKSDKTTLIISDRYSTEYEIGADLEKMFGNGYTLATYSITGGMQLAFNAMSTEDVKQVIPVGVRLPEDGEYTFSLNSQYADADIERLDLIDYETGEVTNLMMSDYRFTATRSQNNNRFALNVVPMAKVPTGMEDTDVRNQRSDVRKIILDDKMFIIRDGLMYDATGKRVVEINK